MSRKSQTHYYGKPKPFERKTHDLSIISNYALDKARRLTIEQFRRAGLPALALEYENSTFVTNPMLAFALYIDRME